MVSNLLKTKTWLRRTLKSGGALAALGIVAVLGAYLFLRSDTARDMIVGFAIDSLDNPGGTQVSFGPIEGAWPEQIIVNDVAVSDPNGSWLTLDRVELRWSPLALVLGRLDVGLLQADTVSLSRLPEGGDDESSPSSGPDGLIEILEWLDRVRIGSLAVSRVELDDTFVPGGQTLSVSGALQSASGPGAELRMSVASLDDRDRLTVTGQRDGAVVTWSLSGQTTGATVAGNGSLNLRRETIDGAVEFSMSPDTVARFDLPIEFSALGGDIDFQIDGNGVEALLTLDTQDFGAGETRLAGLSLDADVRSAGETWRAGLSGSGSGLVTLVPDLAAVADQSFDFEAELSFNGDFDAPNVSATGLRISTGKLSVTGNADFDGTGGAADLTLSSERILSLAGLADTTSRSALQVSLKRYDLEGGLTADLSGEITGLRDGVIDGISTGSDISLAAKVTRETSGTIDVSSLSVTASEIEITGASQWSDTGAHVESSADITVRDGAIKVPDLAFTGRAALAATGPLGQIDLQGSIEGDSLIFRQFSSAGQQLQITARRGEGVWDYQLSGSIETVDGPFSLAASVQQNGPRLDLPSLTLSGEPGRLSADITYDLDSGLIEGDAEFDFASLALPAEVSGQPFRGRAKGTSTFVPVSGTQSINFELTSEDFVYGSDLRIGDASASGTLSDIFNAAGIDAELAAADVFTAGEFIETLNANLDGPFDNLTVDATASSARFSVSTTAEIESIPTGTVVSTDTLDGEIAGVALGLIRGPFVLTIGDDGLSIAPAVLSVGDGTVALSLTMNADEDRILADVTLEGLPASVPGLIDFAGATDALVFGSIRLDGAMTDPMAEVDLTVENIRFPESDVGEVILTTKSTLKNRRLRGQFEMSGFSETPGRITADLPLILNLKDTAFAITSGEPLNVAIAWNGPVGPLFQLVPTVSHRLEGDGLIDLKASGTWDVLEPSGTAQITNGVYENLTTGTVLRSLTADLSATDARTLIFDVSANDGGKGQVTGEGKLTFSDTGTPAIDLQLDFDAAKLIRRDLVRGSATGGMRYAGTPSAGSLTGDLRLTDMEVRLNESFSPAIPLIEVTEIGATPQQSGENEQKAAGNLELDVTAALPGPIVVTANGLISYWRGDLAVGGTAAAPELTGQLTLDRGEYELFGEIFQLTSGSIQFTGGTSFDPVISLVATLDKQDVRAQLRVSGTASDPTIELTSEPVYPQDEILSRILFDKGAGQLGPLEAVQLANAASELSGLAGSGGVVGSLRRAVGLDVLRLGGSDGSSVAVGQRFGRSVYVGVEQGLETDTRQIVVDWRITGNLSLESRVKDDTGADIGLTWKRDY